MSDPAVAAVDIESVAPKWGAKERELWLDMFSNFCAATTGATIEESSGLSHYPEEQLRGDIKLSAELADVAMQEVQYRFFKHAQQVKRRTKRR